MRILAAVANPEIEEKFESRIAILKGFPLFQELDNAELLLLAQKMEALPLPALTELLTQNVTAEAVYFLIEGAVKILVNGEMVAQVDTVQCFGEMSCLLPDTPASASVVTTKECHAFRIQKDVFLDVVNQIPKLWKTLFLQMNGRFKAVNMRLSEVLMHTPQGLIKVDKQGIITKEYSIQCTQYFGKENLSGIEFAQLIHPGKPEIQDLWAQTYPMLFDDSGTLTFADIADLLDRELSFSLENGTKKEFVLSYYPCMSLTGAVEAIDIGIEDVTEAREFERRNAQMIADQTAMGKIYDNPESFLNLKKFILQTLTASIAYVKKLRNDEIQADSEARKEYLRKLHSLKGYAGVFALTGVQQATHQLEELLKREPLAFQSLMDGIVALKEQYLSTEAMFNRIGESLRKRLLGVPFSTSEFALLREYATAGAIPQLLELLVAVEKIDCVKLVSAWPDEAAKIAQSLGKDLEVSVEGDGGAVSKRIFEDLDSVLIHFLRNSIAHGIETPEEREALGKPPVGSLRVRIETDESELSFELQDDGRGIDFSTLAEQAACNESIDPAAIERFVAAEEPWRILFLSGFSTAPEVTELAGRGIGLSAVKTLVDSYKGDIQVESTPDVGTTFRAKIPLMKEA